MLVFLMFIFLILILSEAVPKRILEIMNVRGLTRENVASHLQVWFYIKIFINISFLAKLSFLLLSSMCHHNFMQNGSK